MKTKLFKSCFLAAAVSLFYACSPDEQSVTELEKISVSEKAMTTDMLSFDKGDTRDGAGFVATVKSDGGATIGVSGFQRFYNDYANTIYYPKNPAQYSADNRANLFNTNNAPVSINDPSIAGGIRMSDDQDLSDAAQTGNALIINLNSKANVPDDWAWGGTMYVDFSSLGTVTLTKMVYLDNEEGVVINLYGAANNILHTVTVPPRGAAGNGNKEEINLNNTANVARMEVIQGRDWVGNNPPVGSGAIDDIEFMREVPEDGCTKTQGYWKTHSAAGPAPYDATWKSIGPLEERTIFYLSKQTYLQVLQTPVQGNGYYTLAHQYIATKLNMVSASSTAAVNSAFAEATTIFESKAPSDVKADKVLNNRAKQLAEILDAYNNGVTGPGHCD